MTQCLVLLEHLLAELHGHRLLTRYPIRSLRLPSMDGSHPPGCVVVSPRHPPTAPFLRARCDASGLILDVDPAEAGLLDRLDRRAHTGIDRVEPSRIIITDAGGLKRFVGMLLEHRLAGEIYSEAVRS